MWQQTSIANLSHGLMKCFFLRKEGILGLLKKLFAFYLKDNCFIDFGCFMSNLNMNEP